MANPRTIAKLQARILERAAHCVEFELNDPRVGMITLTRCELSADLAHAKLFYTVLGGPTVQRLTQRVLEDAAGFVQRQVGRVLETRRTPKLRWEFDESIAYAAEMDRKIKEALVRDASIRSEPAPSLDDLVDEEQAEADLIDHEYGEFVEEQQEGEDPPGRESRG
jgi:ribosome-binding factor A